MSRLHASIAVATTFTTLAFCAIPSAQAQPTTLLPNLTPFPASDLSLVTDPATGDLTLRFTTESWNNGAGPLELVGGDVITGTTRQKINQRVYLSDGTSFLSPAGDFVYDADHGHIHMEDYARYTLQPVNAPGGSAITGNKVSFCLLDSTKINTRLPGAPFRAVYTTCGRDVQGISVGWADTYPSYYPSGAPLPGQDLDIANAPDGIYQLQIEIDPDRHLLESDETDNVSCVLLSIQKPSTLTVLDISGQCSSVVSISPNAASAGTSVQVSIAGYGFTDGMAVTFVGGNGPRPVASNVQVTSNTGGLDVLTATVSVPYKKQLGKSPVWDLQVGNSVLKQAFTVTP